MSELLHIYLAVFISVDEVKDLDNDRNVVAGFSPRYRFLEIIKVEHELLQVHHIAK